MTSMHDLPPEILRLILEKVIEDLWYPKQQEALNAIRLVCKLWGEEGAVLMWDHITVWRESQVKELKELGILERYKTRSLSLEQTFQMDEEERETVLSAFDGLEHLELKTGTWSTTVFTRPNLKNLKSLSLDLITMEDGPPISQSDISFNLQKLRIWNYHDPSPTPLSIFHNPSFVHLDFTGGSHPKAYWNDFLLFLQLSAPQFKFLSLSSFDLENKQDILPVLAACTKLESFTVSSYGDVDCAAIFGVIPSQIVHLRCWGNPTKELVTLLNVHSLARLRTLYFVFAKKKDVLAKVGGDKLLEEMERRGVKVAYTIYN